MTSATTPTTPLAPAVRRGYGLGSVATKRAVYAGRPLPGLLRAAAGASLLVVGDHGRSTAVRALLGTVSDGALDDDTGPVAVVHDYERRGGPR